MKWAVIVAGAASAVDPHAGERLLYGAILAASLLLPLAGLVVVLANHGRGGLYYRKRVLALVAMLAMGASSGVACAALSMPYETSPYVMVIISLSSLVSILVAMKLATRRLRLG